MSMQVTVINSQERLTLALTGRFDFCSNREFRGAYEARLKEEGIKEIAVDLGQVEYMDSSALGMLLLLKEKSAVAGKTITLVNCRGVVRQILEVVNFQKLFTIL